MKLCMCYQVIIVSYNAFTGEAQRIVYPANSLAEAEAIERATDPENARERVVTIVPDVMEYLRCHYPDALNRHMSPE